jgi:hypothetical protein
MKTYRVEALVPVPYGPEGQKDWQFRAEEAKASDAWNELVRLRSLPNPPEVRVKHVDVVPDVLPSWGKDYGGY